MDIQPTATDTNSIGENAQHGKVFKILVIGEVGSGGSLDNLKVAIPTRYLSVTEKFPHSEMDILDPTRSKTDTCNEYSFVDYRTSNRYVFLDTPGMSDTRGIQKDDMNMENIVDAGNKSGGLSAVIFIINGAVSIMNSHMQNILTRLDKHFVHDNVINIVILSSTNYYTCNFDVHRLGSWMQNFNSFCMQMSAFSINPNKSDEKARTALQPDWEDSMAEMRKIIQLIESLAPCF